MYQLEYNLPYSLIFTRPLGNSQFNLILTCQNPWCWRLFQCVSWYRSVTSINFQQNWVPWWWIHMILTDRNHNKVTTFFNYSLDQAHSQPNGCPLMTGLFNNACCDSCPIHLQQTLSESQWNSSLRYVFPQSSLTITSAQITVVQFWIDFKRFSIYPTALLYHFTRK